MVQNFLPRYTLGSDAFSKIHEVVSPYGNKVCLLYGEKAFNASKDKLLPYLKGLEIVHQEVYGKEASYANIDRISANEDVKKADVLIGIGGGKCLDATKMVGDTASL